MYRSTAFALAALAGMFALAARGADPAEKMAGTWVANFDNKTKEYVTVKLEDGKWSVSGVLKAGDKEVGSYTGDDCSLKGDALQFKRSFTKKPFPSAKDGEIFTASLDKGELVLTHKVGKNKVSARYAAADTGKPEPKVEAKGELLTKPADVLAKPGDTVRLLVVVGDKVGISEKHFEALKKGKITKLEATFAGFEEPEQRLVVSDVTDQPKELDLEKGTYRMAVVFDRGGSLKGLEVPAKPAMYFCAVKLPAQFYLSDIKLVGEAKGKFKARTADATEGAIYVLEAKVVKWSK